MKLHPIYLSIAVFSFSAPFLEAKANDSIRRACETAYRYDANACSSAYGGAASISNRKELAACLNTATANRNHCLNQVAILDSNANSLVENASFQEASANEENGSSSL
jgi:hypothetical protein